MPADRKFRVYLAGPMSGCNDVQMCRWRNAVKKAYGSKMTILDPVDNLLSPDASPYEFVEADLQNIMEADGLLVNMWQESIGTAMGVAHAHRYGRAIVVADPNHLENKMLTFFADAVEENPLQAAKALLNLLRAERSWRVVKSGARTDEPFERRKIMEAARAACRDAKRDDMVIPRLVLPRVIERLLASDRKVDKSLTTTDIDNAVTDVLNALESDALHSDSVSGVLHAWRDCRDERARLMRPARIRTDRNRLPTAQVPVSCGSKSHGTIWGHTIKRTEDIPSAAARHVLGIIVSIQGITRITLGQFGHKSSRSSCQAWVGESNTPYIIEGRLYDTGPKGTMQSFQVWVQSDEAKLAVSAEIESALRREDTWAGR